MALDIDKHLGVLPAALAVRGRELRGQPDVSLSLDESPTVRALRSHAQRFRDRLLERLR